MAKIIVGNIHIETKPTVIELRLVTPVNGVAVFGYGEIPNLIATLKSLTPATKQHSPDDDWKDLV